MTCSQFPKYQRAPALKTDDGKSNGNLVGVGHVCGDVYSALRLSYLSLFASSLHLIHWCRPAAQHAAQHRLPPSHIFKDYTECTFVTLILVTATAIPSHTSQAHCIQTHNTSIIPMSVKHPSRPTRAPPFFTATELRAISTLKPVSMIISLEEQLSVMYHQI